MKTSAKLVVATSVIVSLMLTGCGDAKKGASVPIGDAPQEVEQVVEVAPLPVDAAGLQDLMIESFAAGNMDRFEAAKSAFVNDIADRRVQRDFVSALWEGKAPYEKNQTLAFPIAKSLSDAYDISACTYLTGMAYWTGSGTEKDFGETLKYWAKPGVEGNATVHYRRAMIYLNPDLPYYDAAQGRELMVKASGMGNQDAATWLAGN